MGNVTGNGFSVVPKHPVIGIARTALLPHKTHGATYFSPWKPMVFSLFNDGVEIVMIYPTWGCLDQNHGVFPSFLYGSNWLGLQSFFCKFGKWWGRWALRWQGSLGLSGQGRDEENFATGWAARNRKVSLKHAKVYKPYTTHTIHVYIYIYVCMDGCMYR